jgi:hypothetical protein
MSRVLVWWRAGDATPSAGIGDQLHDLKEWLYG